MNKPKLQLALPFLKMFPPVTLHRGRDIQDKKSQPMLETFKLTLLREI